MIQVVNSARNPSASDWPLSSVDVGVQIGDRQRSALNSPRCGRRSPESRQRLELLQRDDQVPVCGWRPGSCGSGAVTGMPSRFFAFESVHRLLATGMGLQRQWFVGRQHLGQERQGVTGTGPAPGTELRLRVGADRVRAASAHRHRSRSVPDRQDARRNRSSASGCCVGFVFR